MQGVQPSTSASTAHPDDRPSTKHGNGIGSSYSVSASKTSMSQPPTSNSVTASPTMAAIQTSTRNDGSPRSPFENPVSAVDYISARGGIKALKTVKSPLEMWSMRMAGNMGWGLGEAATSFDLDTDEEEDCDGGLLSGSPEKWANILAAIAQTTNVKDSSGAGNGVSGVNQGSALVNTPIQRTQAGATVRRSLTSPAGSCAAAATAVASTLQSRSMSRTPSPSRQQVDKNGRQNGTLPPAPALIPIHGSKNNTLSVGNEHPNTRNLRSPSMPDLTASLPPSDNTGTGYNAGQNYQDTNRSMSNHSLMDPVRSKQAVTREPNLRPTVHHRRGPSAAPSLTDLRHCPHAMAKRTQTTLETSGTLDRTAMSQPQSTYMMKRPSAKPEIRSNTDPLSLPHLNINDTIRGGFNPDFDKGGCLLEKLGLGSRENNSQHSPSVLSISPVSEDKTPLSGTVDMTRPTSRAASPLNQRSTYAQVAAANLHRQPSSNGSQSNSSAKANLTAIEPTFRRRPSADYPSRSAPETDQSQSSLSQKMSATRQPSNRSDTNHPIQRPGDRQGRMQQSAALHKDAKYVPGSREDPDQSGRVPIGQRQYRGHKRVSRSLERPPAVVAADEKYAVNLNAASRVDRQHDGHATPKETFRSIHPPQQDLQNKHSVDPLRKRTLYPDVNSDRASPNAASTTCNGSPANLPSSHDAASATNTGRSQMLVNSRLPALLHELDEQNEGFSRMPFRCGPVLQVITSRTVKDRILFLFQNVLVITKPIVTEHKRSAFNEESCLSERYQCRAIIPLGDISMTTIREEAISPPDLPGLMGPEICHAVRSFPGNSYRILRWLLDSDLLKRDAASVAGFLLRTRGLNRQEVGMFLAQPENVPVLAAFLERVPARGIALPDLLRLVGQHMQLPPATDNIIRLTASHTDNVVELAPNWRLCRPSGKVSNGEGNDHPYDNREIGPYGDPGADPNEASLRARCLILIADRWRQANLKYHIGRRAVVALTYAILDLDRKIHQPLSHRPKPAADDEYMMNEFIRGFKQNYSNYCEDDGHPIAVPDQLLRQIYISSVSHRIMLDYSTDNHTIHSDHAVRSNENECDPSGRLWISVDVFPLRLTVRVPSAEILFRIPRPDSGIQLRVFAEEGLLCSNELISFESSREARITFTGISVGRCVVAFSLMGENASHYSPIPPRTLSIERGFMRWAFRIRSESTYFSQEDLPSQTPSRTDSTPLPSPSRSYAPAHPPVSPSLPSPINLQKTQRTNAGIHHDQESLTTGNNLATANSSKKAADRADNNAAEERPPLALCRPMHPNEWSQMAVGRGRTVKLLFSVDSRERRNGWCSSIEEHARVIREVRDHSLPPNAPIGAADVPGRATRDRVIATQLGRLLLPISDDAASGSLIFTGRELVRLVAHHERMVRE